MPKGVYKRSASQLASISKAAKNRTPEHKRNIKMGRVRNGSYKEIGTRVIDKCGYIWIKISHDLGRKNWKQEHRLVMERYLKRVLRTDEHVHHIDGDKANNEMDNLAVVDRREHGIINLLQKIVDCMDDRNFDIAMRTLKARREKQEGMRE